MELWKVSRKKKKYLQHIFSEASLPFGLIEEVIKVAAERDENKTKRKEPKNPWRKREDDTSQRIDTRSVERQLVLFIRLCKQDIYAASPITPRR